MPLDFTSHTAELVLLLFLFIVFLQSGLDKIVDWNGNLSWLKEHFSKTLFKNLVPLLLGTITLLEILTGILAFTAVVKLILHGEKLFAFYAAVCGCLTLLMLLFGQRMAKDYEGARTLVVYLIATVFLLYLVQ